MNLKEGTRRLALLLGAVGAILGGSASYMELQTTLSQRARHNRFEQLSNSDVVQQERKNLQAEPNDWQTVPDDKWAKYAVKGKNVPQIDPKTGERTQAAPDPYAAIALPNPSDVNKGGIKTINWIHNYVVESIETEDGQKLYPTPVPSAWTYLLMCSISLAGILHPLGNSARNRMGGSWFLSTTVAVGRSQSRRLKVSPKYQSEYHHLS